LILAETLLRFVRRLEEPERAATADDIGSQIRFGESIDRGVISDLSYRAFTDFRSHYSANPDLDPEGIRLGYAEWAVTELDTQDVFLVHETDGNLDGFISMGLNGSTAKIVLNAVDPLAQGKGIYGTLVQGALSIAQQRACQSIEVSTPATNPTPIRVWSQNKFRYLDAFYTFHVMKR
jgi:GNAT superfamily N-acetyltransferase